MKPKRNISVMPNEVEQFLETLELELSKDTKLNDQLQEYLNERNLSFKDIKVSRLIGNEIWLVLQKGTAGVEIWLINGEVKVVLPL